MGKFKKNLFRLIDSGMSSNSKVGLGYEIKSNNEVLSYKEEMENTIFGCKKEDFVDKPVYNRFVEFDNFKGVQPPLNGDYTPLPEKDFDESLYVYGKKGPQVPEINVTEDKTSEYSTCQSDDSEGSIRNIFEHSKLEPESIPSEVSKPKSVKIHKPIVSAPKPKPVEPSC